MADIQIVNSFGNKVYNFSARKKWPDFIKETIERKQTSKGNKSFDSRLEIIQGLEFAGYSQKVDISQDLCYIGAIGMYPPDLKVYDVNDLSMKFCRRLDSEIIDFLFLSNDYKKMVMLGSDRNLEFHDQSGAYHKLRVPTYSKKLLYDSWNAFLLVGSTSEIIYKLDLYEGIFADSLEIDGHEVISMVKCNSSNDLYIGTNSQFLEKFDLRVGIHNISKIKVINDNEVSDLNSSIKVTALASNNQNEDQLAVGNSYGVVKIYDVRMPSTHLYYKNHHIDSDIKSIEFHQSYTSIGEKTSVISADSNFIKAWDCNSSLKIKDIVSFKTQGKITNFKSYPKSGLIFVAQDNPRVGVHFIPELGIAPSWVPFVDQMVEEMDTNSKFTFFDDFEFITRADISRYGKSLEEISDIVKPFQHGFLIRKTDHENLRSQKNLMTDLEIFHENIKTQIEKDLMNDYFRTKVNLKTDKDIDTEAIDVIKTISEDKSKFNKKSAKAARMVLEDTRFDQLFEK